MVCQACHKKDKLPYRIQGQTRPFIDENLQFRLPGLEPLLDQAFYPSTSHQIHAYYSHSGEAVYSDFLETELNQAMTDSQQAYETWKQIQHKLKESFQSYSP